MRTNLSVLWEHIPQGLRKRFFILLILMILASFAEVVSIGAVIPFLAALTNPEELYEYALIKSALNYLDWNSSQSLVLLLTVVFSAAAVISGILRLTLLWAQTRLSHAVGADLSINIYRRTLYQPYQVHASRNSGEIIAGVSQKANEVVHLTVLPIMIIISSLIMITAILITLLSIEPMIATLAFSGFGLIYITIIVASKKSLKRNSQVVSQKQNQVIKTLNEGLGGIRDILIDGMQETYCEAFRKEELPLRRARANIQIISGSPRFFIEALGMVLIAWIAYSLISDEENFAVHIPVLGALALGAQRLLPVLQQAYANLTLVRGGQASLEDALGLLSQPVPEHLTEPNVQKIQFKSSLQIDNVSFSYQSASKQILENINLTINKGQRVGFIGATGSGKSTLLDIIMGLLPPTSGQMTVDGVMISEENSRAWQAHIAHVPQTIFLADTTIAENIALGIPKEKIDQQRLEEAARKARISEVIEELELKYDTHVGERGIRLSGGQRQRIGIARALYKNANLIVFDEATSALDNDTEKAVMDAISDISDDVTVLIIAHRLSTLKDCDAIVKISEGKVVNTGTYENIV